MRTTATIFIAFCYLCALCLGAESNLVERFPSMTLKEVDETIHSNEGYPHLHAFATAAVRSKRMDLIAHCQDDPNFGGYIATAIEELPDSQYRDQMLIRLLKREWDTDTPRSFGHVLIVPRMYETLVAKYFPTLPINDSLFQTREARLQLTAKLEAAMAKIPASPAPIVLPKATSPVATLELPSNRQPAPATEQASSETPTWPKLLALAAALAVIGSTIFFLRKK